MADTPSDKISQKILFFRISTFFVGNKKSCCMFTSTNKQTTTWKSTSSTPILKTTIQTVAQ
jgi:hypothetical protein